MVQMGSSSFTADRSARLQQSRAQLRRIHPTAKQTLLRNKFGGNQLGEIPNPMTSARLPFSQEEQEQQKFDQSRSAAMFEQDLVRRSRIEENQSQTLRQSRNLMATQQAMVNRSTADQAQEEETTKKTEEEREEQKRKETASMLNGSFMASDILSTGIDASTMGTSFLFSLIYRIPSLAYRNIQMIYGTYFAKGKSRYVSPISWDPIPMPVDKGGLILAGFIIAADIALAVAIVVVMFGGFCIVHDVTKIKDTPLQAGINLAQGGSEMCLGGIITSIFGL